MARALSWFQQFRLLLRRNVLILRRDKRSLTMPILLPVLITFLLASMQGAEQQRSGQQTSNGQGQAMSVRRGWNPAAAANQLMRLMAGDDDGDGGGEEQGEVDDPASVTQPVRFKPVQSIPDFSLALRRDRSLLLYAPADSSSVSYERSYVERVMDGVRAQIDAMGPGPGGRKWSDQLVKGLPNAQAIDAFWERQSQTASSFQDDKKNPSTTKQQRVWAAVVFDDESTSQSLPSSLPCDVSYTLRFNGSALPSTDASKQILDDRALFHGSMSDVQTAREYAAALQDPEVMEAWKGSGGGSIQTAQYLASGFIGLQTAINRAVLNVRAEEMYRANTNGTEPQTSMSWLSSSYDFFIQSFPDVSSPSSSSTNTIFGNLGPLYTVLGYMPLCQKLVQSLVLEKEKKVKVYMSICGMKDGVFAASWMVAYFFISLIPLFLSSFMSDSVEMYRWTSSELPLLLSLFYILNLFIFALLISTFFSKTKVAAQVAGTGIFLLFLPFYVLDGGFGMRGVLDGGGSGASAGRTFGSGLAMLSPPIAFARGMSEIARAESMGKALTMTSAMQSLNVDHPSISFTIGECIIFLVFDALIMLSMALYLDAVVPNEFGVAKEWNILCRPCLGRKKKRGYRRVERGGDGGDGEMDDDDDDDANHQQPLSVSSLAPPPSLPCSPSPAALSQAHQSTPPPVEERLDGSILPMASPSRMVVQPMEQQGKGEHSHEIRPGIRIQRLHKVFETESALWRCFKNLCGRCSCCAASRRPNATSNDGSVHALRGLSLHIYRGQVLALLGPNASGKTTTVSILSGLLPSTSGRVVFEGLGPMSLSSGLRSSVELCSEHLTSIRERMFVAPQEEIFFDKLSVREHLTFFAQLRSVPPHKMTDHILEKLREMGLEEKIDERVGSLSGGMKRKLCIAIALMGIGVDDDDDDNPSESDCRDILILDEPSSGVDPLSRRSIWQVIRKYRPGRIILLTTHSMVEAESLADRIAIVCHGRLQCAGTNMFLKRHYSAGYKLDIDLDPRLARAAGGRAVKELEELVLNTVPGSRRVEAHSWMERHTTKPTDSHTTGIDEGHKSQDAVEHDSEEEIAEFESRSNDELRREPSDSDSRQQNELNEASTLISNSSSSRAAAIPCDGEPLTLHFQLPLTSLSHFSSLFHHLESPPFRRRVGIVSSSSGDVDGGGGAGFSLSLNSLEEIFHKVVQQADEAEATKELKQAQAHSDRNVEQGAASVNGEDDEYEDDESLSSRTHLRSSNDPLSDSFPTPLNRRPSSPSFSRVFTALALKRLWLWSSEKRSFLFLVLFPAAYVAFGLVISLQGVNTDIWHQPEKMTFSPARFTNGAAPTQGTPSSATMIVPSAFDTMFTRPHRAVPLAFSQFNVGRAENDGSASNTLHDRTWIQQLFAPPGEGEEFSSIYAYPISITTKSSGNQALLHDPMSASEDDDRSDVGSNATPTHISPAERALINFLSLPPDYPDKKGSIVPPLHDDESSDDHAYAHVAIRIAERQYQASHVTGDKPLSAGSPFTLYYNNSAAHAVPVLLNSIFSNLLDTMQDGSDVWVVDPGAVGGMRLLAQGQFDVTDSSNMSTCPRRSISVASAPFAYASSPVLLHTASFIIGFLLVLALSGVPTLFPVSIMRHEKNEIRGTAEGGEGTNTNAAGGGGGGTGKDDKSVSTSAATCLALQRLHGGGSFMYRFWLVHTILDGLVLLLPIILVYLLFATFGNRLLSDSSFGASACFFFLWSFAMCIHAYIATFIFSKSQTLNLVLTLVWGLGCIFLAIGLGAWEFAMAALTDAERLDESSGNWGSGGRAKSDTANTNPFAGREFDFMMIYDSVITGRAAIILIALMPAFALPWSIIQLGMFHYLKLKREAVCASVADTQPSNQHASVDPETGIPCQPSHASELFAFKRLGGLLFGLVLSMILSAIFILYKERYLVKWWRKAFGNKRMKHAVPIYSARVSDYQLPAQGSPSQSSQPVPNQLGPIPQNGSRRPLNLDASTSSVEMTVLSPSPSPSLPTLAPGTVLPSSIAPSTLPSATHDPPDVASERLRVYRQFNNSGQPLMHEDGSSVVDPITIFNLSKSFPLKESIVLPPRALTSFDSAQLQLPSSAVHPFANSSVSLPTIIREKAAIDRLTLGVRAGENFAVLGPNGAGKSSTLSVLTGSLRPDSGDALCHGISCVDPAGSPHFDLVSDQVGFVPQSSGLFDSLTTFQHLLLYGRIKGVREGMVRRRAKHMMSALGLHPHADTKSEHLSGGTKRKLALSIALMGNPSILFCDEVSTGVDVTARKAMWQLLHSTRAASNPTDAIGTSLSSRSCLLTTHSLEEAEALCHRMVIMINGRARCIGTARQLKERYGGGMELQIQIHKGTRSSHRAQQQQQQPDGGSSDSAPTYAAHVSRIVAFVRALIDDARQPSRREHVKDNDTNNDRTVSSLHERDDGTASTFTPFDPSTLPPLPGFPFHTKAHHLSAKSDADDAPSTVSSSQMSGTDNASPSSTSGFVSARLISDYNGLLTFALPTPPPINQTHRPHKFPDPSQSHQPSSESSTAATDHLSASSSSSTSVPSFSFSRFFAYMCRYQSELGIVDFTLNQCTLEQVFLTFTKEQLETQMDM